MAKSKILRIRKIPGLYSERQKEKEKSTDSGSPYVMEETFTSPLSSMQVLKLLESSFSSVKKQIIIYMSYGCYKDKIRSYEML